MKKQRVLSCYCVSSGFINGLNFRTNVVADLEPLVINSLWFMSFKQCSSLWIADFLLIFLNINDNCSAADA